ncbi:MAG: IPTL-CTERM sorting domain-containing protein, partial [Lysobacterales bacterium]
GAVAALLAANGVNVGDSIALVHRAVVTDGTNTVPGATADVTLSLGFIDNETVPVPTMGQIGTSILVLLMALAGFAGYRRLHV